MFIANEVNSDHLASKRAGSSAVACGPGDRTCRPSAAFCLEVPVLLSVWILRPHPGWQLCLGHCLCGNTGQALLGVPSPGKQDQPPPQRQGGQMLTAAVEPRASYFTFLTSLWRLAPSSHDRFYFSGLCESREDDVCNVCVSYLGRTQ